MTDAGVSQRALALESGIPRSYLSRILHHKAMPSASTYARLGAVLGADFSMRFFPNTGARIHDRHQAAMLEVLLGSCHRRWEPFTEVAVRKPSRGWIDLVLHEPRERLAPRLGAPVGAAPARAARSVARSEGRRTPVVERLHAARRRHGDQPAAGREAHPRDPPGGERVREATSGRLPRAPGRRDRGAHRHDAVARAGHRLDGDRHAGRRGSSRGDEGRERGPAGPPERRSCSGGGTDLGGPKVASVAGQVDRGPGAGRRGTTVPAPRSRPRQHLG